MQAPLQPLQDTLNRPTAKLGIEYKYVLIPPAAAVLFFFISHVGAVLGLIFFYGCAAYISTRKDDQIVRLALANLWHKTLYDPFR
jgi:type IV secretory pathway VirB3-like protein